MKELVTIRKPKDIIDVTQRWKRCRQENFLVITLNGAHEVIKVHHVSKGLLNKTIVHPRECYFHAIKDYAAAVVFVHNHPSGRALSSIEDDMVTDRLCMAGNILGIEIIDHIIITPDDCYFSYRENGKIVEDYSTEEQRLFIEELAAEGK
jgi:DNA repair protein RadC